METADAQDHLFWNFHDADPLRNRHLGCGKDRPAKSARIFLFQDVHVRSDDEFEGSPGPPIRRELSTEKKRNRSRDSATARLAAGRAPHDLYALILDRHAPVRPDAGVPI